MKRKQVNDPFQYLITKREIILHAISEESTLPGAWKALTEQVPEIEHVIRFNTFKVYARILVKFGQVIDEKETELDKVRQEVNSLKKVPVKQQEESAPKRFKGWGVQLNRGYYRLFKKIGGKVKWIYIGKKWNQTAASKKIGQFRLDKNI